MNIIKLSFFIYGIIVTLIKHKFQTSTYFRENYITNITYIVTSSCAGL